MSATRARRLDLQAVRAEAGRLFEAGDGRAALDLLLRVLADTEADRLRLLRRHLGQTSEQVSSAQLSLLRELLGEAPCAEEKALSPPDVELPEETTPKHKRKPHGRGKLPDDLPREERRHLVPEEERPCPSCGGPRQCIGWESSETLEHVPARFYVIVDLREKLACRPCAGAIDVAPAPPKIIEKGRPGPGLLADLMIGKFVDHLPLTRQQSIFRREGVELSVSTMVDWVAAVASTLAPLASRLEDLVLGAYVLGADDTGIKVLAKDAPGGARRGHLWCYVGDATHVVFRYTPDWTKEAPQAFLARRVGWLQADAYRGYDGIFKRPGGATAIEVGCWAHARRPFAELALDRDARAAPVVELMRKLYQVERHATEAGVDADERLRRRQSESAPIVDAIVLRCQQIRGQYPPSDPLAKAAGYVLNQERALRRFLEDGALPIDNTLVERRLRPIALGRRNYLFCGSDAGAERAAIIYSLAGTCALVGVDPRAYLAWVLDQLELRRVKHSQIDEVLPASYAKICPPSARLPASR